MLPSLRGRSNLLQPLCQTLRLLHLSSSPAAVDANASPNPNFMVDYLVRSCGFSVAEASKVSKPLGHLQSTEKADTFVNFMRCHGFADSHLRKVISTKPQLLCSDVERNLAPKFQSLLDMGLSESELVDVIRSNPCILSLSLRCSVFPRLKVWEGLLGSRKHLLKHMKRKRWFFTHSIENKVLPNLKFLKDDCGIPKERVSLVLRMKPDFIVQKLDSLQALAVRADKMGVPRQSKMFLWVLYVLYMVSKEKIEAHVNIMRNFGWSESDFFTAVRKQPSFLGLSQGALQRKMEFLVNDVGCSPAYIAERPKLLMLSSVKRIVPRLRVMKMLKSKGLWTAQNQVLPFFSTPHAKFYEKFILPYREEVPELFESF